MSNSSTATGKSKYIWDEWGDEDNLPPSRAASAVPSRPSDFRAALPSYENFPPPSSSSARSAAARNFEQVAITIPRLRVTAQ